MPSALIPSRLEKVVKPIRENRPGPQGTFTEARPDPASRGSSGPPPPEADQAECPDAGQDAAGAGQDAAQDDADEGLIGPPMSLPGRRGRSSAAHQETGQEEGGP
jgi:hypothetical protein